MEKKLVVFGENELNNSILNYFERYLFLNDFNNIPMKNNAGDMLADIIYSMKESHPELYKKYKIGGKMTHSFTPGIMGAK